MGKSAYLEILTILALVAIGGLVLAKNRAAEGPTAKPVPERTEQPPRSPVVAAPVTVASIGGVKLGDTAERVLNKWGKHQRLEKDGATRWLYYPSGYIGLDGSQVVISVRGKCLELDGKTILGPLSVDIEDVESKLGKPDRTGFAGVAMCEGPFPGYRYERLQLSVDFSCSSGTSFQLEKQRIFENFDGDDSPPDLADCISSHRRGAVFRMPRGQK